MSSRPATVLALAAALALLATGCLGGKLNLGVSDPSARSNLGVQRIAYVKEGALYLARGDATHPVRLFRGEELGPGGTIFLPALSSDRRKVLFIGALDLQVHDSTASSLQLHILELDGERVEAWRSIVLDKIIPPDGSGRREIFGVAAAAWSRDSGRIALGLNRSKDEGGDRVMIFDSEGVPVTQVVLGDRSLPRVGAIDWMGPESMIVGLEGEESAQGRVARLDLGAGPGSAPTLVDLGAGDYPALGPSLDRIAVVDYREGQWDIVLLDPDGREIGRYERPAGRAINRPFWSDDGRYLFYYSLASTGPLGIVEINMIRCLDTRSRRVFDLVRLG